MAQPDALLADLSGIAADLDRLIADRIAGQAPSIRRGSFIDQVEELADRLRASVRGPGRPVHAPAFVSACGTKAGW